MMTSKEYIKNKKHNSIRESLNRIRNTLIENVLDKYEYNKDPQILADKCSNTVEVHRIEGKGLYLFAYGRYVNLARLNRAIKVTYGQNGYNNIGISRIPEEEMLRYKFISDLITSLMLKSSTAECDPERIALDILQKEMTYI